MSKIILSGAQPSGTFHLGNLLGAFDQWNNLTSNLSQDDLCLFMSVDLHALTTQRDSNLLRKNRENSIKSYLSIINPDKRVKIFFQSDIKEIANLGWILSTNINVGSLFRMTQFKDKRGNNSEENINSGLLFYPTLMAADILMFDADIVPVGEDQKQHIELTRDIAEKFNHNYGKTFKLPQIKLNQETKRIMSLQNPLKKMSKSSGNDKDLIYITDTDDQIAKKIKSAVTDSIPRISYDPENRPGLANLINIMASISNQKIDNIIKEFSQSEKVTALFKSKLIDEVIRKISPIRERFNQISISDFEKKIKEDSEFARDLSSKKLKEVYNKIGL